MAIKRTQIGILTPLKTNEHTPLLHQSPFPLCYIGVVCFLLPELGAFFQRSQLNLASFVVRNDNSSGKVLCCVHSLRTELAVVVSAVYLTDLRSLRGCYCNGTVRNRNW